MPSTIPPPAIFRVGFKKRSNRQANAIGSGGPVSFPRASCSRTARADCKQAWRPPPLLLKPEIAVDIRGIAELSGESNTAVSDRVNDQVEVVKRL